MIANIQALCKCPCGIEFYERRPHSDFSLALSLSEGVNSINSRGVRMKRLKLLICSGTLFLAGCADVANYQANLQTWVGRSEQTLEATWGAPTSTTQNGTVRLLTYIRNDGTFVAGGYWGPRVQSLFCTTTFSVVNGLIAQAQFEGNECVAY